MTTSRRWLTSALATASTDISTFPWTRATRRRPAAVRAPVAAPAKPSKSGARAAR
jgi:hypothetical protein